LHSLPFSFLEKHFDICVLRQARTPTMLGVPAQEICDINSFEAELPKAESASTPSHLNLAGPFRAFLSARTATGDSHAHFITFEREDAELLPFQA
jgi:hypothetical protein